MNLQIYTSVYTPSSSERFKQALDDALKVMNDADATSSSILKAKQDLQDSITGLTKLASFDYLKTLIDEYSKLDETLYTSASFEQLKDKLAKAQDVYNDKNSSQETVDNMCNELTEAKNQLVLKGDKTDLIALMEEIKKLDRSLYLEATLNELDTYLQKAQTVVDNDQATNDDVLKAYQDLYNVRDNLVTQESYQNLKALLDKVENVDESKYTDQSLQVLKTKYQQAKDAYEKAVPKKDEIAKATQELQQAFNSLQLKVNKEKLQNTIIKATSIDRSQYTPASLLKLDSEVAKAKALLDKVDVTQTEIDDMTKSLTTMLNSLVLKADKNKLSQLVKEIEKLDLGQYQNTGKLITLLNQSKELLNNDNATQAEIDQMYSSLQNAYKQIEKVNNDKTGSNDTVQENKTVNENVNKKENVETKDTDSTNLSGLFVILMMSLLGIIFIKKRIS